MKERGKFFTMRYIIKSTTTRTQGWQADCWNWAKANLPFKVYGVESQHLAFCRTLVRPAVAGFIPGNFATNWSPRLSLRFVLVKSRACRDEYLPDGCGGANGAVIQGLPRF